MRLTQIFRKQAFNPNFQKSDQNTKKLHLTQIFSNPGFKIRSWKTNAGGIPNEVLVIFYPRDKDFFMGWPFY